MSMLADALDLSDGVLVTSAGPCLSPIKKPLSSVLPTDVEGDRDSTVLAAIRLLSLLLARYMLEQSDRNGIMKILPGSASFGRQLLELQRKCLQRHFCQPLAPALILMMTMFASLFPASRGIISEGSGAHAAFLQGGMSFNRSQRASHCAQMLLMYYRSAVSCPLAVAVQQRRHGCSMHRTCATHT